MNRSRTFIIDDEEHARLRIRKLLEAHPEINVVREIASGAEAVEAIESEHPELIFLDIHLPDFDGFHVLQSLTRPPCVIFTTCFDQYALRAFDAAGIDYLLKPVEPPQLERAVGKFELIRNAPESDAFGRRVASLLRSWQIHPPKQYMERVAVPLGERILLIGVREISHFFAKDKYVFLHTTTGKEYIVSNTIAELEELLDPTVFVRVHRSTLVNVKQIREIHTWVGGKYRLITGDKDGSQLVVSKNMAKRLKAVIPF
jgi:two-component system, LytTR family, response regulator